MSHIEGARCALMRSALRVKHQFVGTPPESIYQSRKKIAFIHSFIDSRDRRMV